MIETILTAMLGGAATGIITVVTLKNDIKWLKETLVLYGERITFLERNI